MIKIYQEFKTEQEALDFKLRMYRNYHPMGYGTHITVEQRGNTWVAYGSRSHSCD